MVAFNLKVLIAGAALVSASAATPAFAQYIGSNSAEYNAGYGRYPGQENQVPNYGTRDMNGNRVIVDGVIMSGEDQSVYSNASSSAGVSSSVSGVGSWGGGSTAIGNNLVVVTQGNYNTVIVTSTQTNNGDVTANTANGVGNAN